mmetsp:Transcript_39273/g.76833  ORF Transcript_39273/g.76833 Transcript_39273/m.76833 type:complete len:603 (+) Transcript_39273:71-1879(+)
MVDAETKALAQGWLEVDYLDSTRSIVEKMLADGDAAGLKTLLGSRLAFGTAGLRGPMGAGYARMNHVTVFQCTQGIVAYLLKTYDEADLKEKGVVIGYDHRKHACGVDSEMMARAAAAACHAKGIKTYLFSQHVCTPMIPFTVKNKGCKAGMMVTASHNPKADNGYKMYGANGAQLCEPHDTLIAELILQNLAPWVDYKVAVEQVMSSPLKVDDLAALMDAYYKEMGETLCFHKATNGSSTLKIVYTAMHGVGTPFATRSFATFGHNAFIGVPSQNTPDPEFPTVPYPNPEEGKGALEMAFQAAKGSGATLVLANDPDADRLAVAELQPSGAWRMFSGNEIGMLLSHWLWSKSVEKGVKDKLAVVASTVSSKMTRALAEKEGMRFEETLTGFKWICNKKFDLQQEGYKVLLAFEESIGFCCGDLVNDKDGVCAMSIFAEMANQLHEKKMNVNAHMEELYNKYGHFVSRQGYVTVPDPKLTVDIFSKLREGGKYPTSVGGFKIAHVRDLTVGYDSSTKDNKTTLPASTSSQHLTFTFENGCVANLRGSGTEPKLKFYVELHGANKDEVTATLIKMVNSIVDECLEPPKWNLKWTPLENESSKL